MKTKSVDIIVPVGELTLNRFSACIEGIRSQSFEQWTTYLIESNVTDEVHLFINDLCAKDTRFISVASKGEGPSAVRNTGLDYVTSEYFTFCDADDVLTQDALEFLVAAAERHKLDMVCCGIDEQLENGQIIHHAMVDIPQEDIVLLKTRDEILKFAAYVLGPQETDSLYTHKLPWFGRVYGKLYRRSQLKHIKLVSSLWLHEDNVYALDTILESQSIGLISRPAYVYIRHSDSLTKQGSFEGVLQQEITFMNELKSRIDVYQSVFLNQSYVKRMAMVIKQRLHSLARNATSEVQIKCGVTLFLEYILNEKLFDQSVIRCTQPLSLPDKFLIWTITRNNIGFKSLVLNLVVRLMKLNC